MIIPEQVLIETVNGKCTVKCIMCGISDWTRKPNIMNKDVFIAILEKLKPYQKRIPLLTLFGCGEPLLDKGLSEKIRIAKKMGFIGLGFASNCTELYEDRSRELIEAGLDTIICSIDGIKSETHEAIRIGANFEKIVRNFRNFIEIRNKIGKTKVLIRFVRQEINKHEWTSFLAYWRKEINKDYGDEVIRFDVHNWGNTVEGYNLKDVNRETCKDKIICNELSIKLLIRSRGEMAFCDADDNGFFELGNAIVEDPIKIYNNEIFKKYRTFMKNGRISELEYCKDCTIPRSLLLKECH